MENVQGKFQNTSLATFVVFLGFVICFPVRLCDIFSSQLFKLFLVHLIQVSCFVGKHEDFLDELILLT